MHKKLLTLALGGVAIIGVLAGASYFSGGSLLSSVLPTTTTPTCQEQENDVSLAQDALKQFPERANITERVAVLQEAVNTAAGNVTKLEQVAFAAAKKLRYSDLSALMSDYKKYTELAQKMSAKNVEIKKSTAEVTRLSRLKPRTADVSAQIKKEQVKLSAIKEELSKINKERSVLNASIKKITRSTATIDVLYNKYIKKAVSNLSEAQKSLSEAQKSLELVLTEQKPIVDAETKLASAEKALEMCRAKTPETPKESVTYCFPTYQSAAGDVQTNCVDDVSKIPQCYVKSTTTAIYDDETGELSSVNVVSDDNTKELFFCGDPETAYLDPANPSSGYPTMPGQGSNPGAEAAAPMGAENPNNPKNNPDDPISKTCSGEGSNGNVPNKPYYNYDGRLLNFYVDPLNGDYADLNIQPCPKNGDVREVDVCYSYSVDPRSETRIKNNRFLVRQWECIPPPDGVDYLEETSCTDNVCSDTESKNGLCTWEGEDCYFACDDSQPKPACINSTVANIHHPKTTIPGRTEEVEDESVILWDCTRWNKSISCSYSDDGWLPLN